RGGRGVRSPIDQKYRVEYGRFLDPGGYPAVKPPWGTLSAIDLNTGRYVWKVPLGEYRELAANGMTATGCENYGGPLVTAGGLVFIGATSYDGIGLELYSVRDAMGRDPERTLAAVRAMGYRDVELLWSFGNFGRTTEQVRAALDREGLRAPSAHVSAAVVLVGWERSLAIAK